MALAEIASGVQILGGLAGLFGKKVKVPTPRDNMMSQAQGARDAAEKYGFNPLTMLQYGNVGGSFGSQSGGSVPPLASVEAIVGGLQDLGEARASESEQRKALADKRKQETLVALDQMRGLAPVSDAVFGNRARNATSVGAPVPKDPLFDPPKDRPIKKEPTTNLWPFFYADHPLANEWNAGKPLPVLGTDGDPWDVFQLMSVAGQAAYHRFRHHNDDALNSWEYIKDGLQEKRRKNTPTPRETNRNNAHGIRLPVSR